MNGIIDGVRLEDKSILILMEEILKRVKIYSKDINVEAINMLAYYKPSGNIIIDLSLITKEKLNVYETIKYNDNVLIRIFDVLNTDYDIESKDLNKIERIVDLYNGELVYDSEDKYRKLKDKITKIFTLNNVLNKKIYTNKIDIPKRLEKVK